jgi:hypothetical protein
MGMAVVARLLVIHMALFGSSCCGRYRARAVAWVSKPICGATAGDPDGAAQRKENLEKEGYIDYEKLLLNYVGIYSAAY